MASLEISKEEIDRLSTAAMSWCLAHGLVMGAKGSPTMVQHCPVSLVPTRVPRESFARAQTLSPLFNKLVDAAARDFEWLEATLEDAAKADADFTGRLLEIAQKVTKEGVAQEAMLALNRSDYMLHAPDSEGSSGGGAKVTGLLQVELNTIAASFGALSSLTGQLQKFLIERFAGAAVPGGVPGLWAHVAGRAGGDSAASAAVTAAAASTPSLELPQPVKQLPVAIAKAVALYGSSSAGEKGPAARVVIFVVQAGDTNSTDQRLLEYELFEQCGAPVVRLTLEEVSKRCTLDSARGRALVLDGKHEVAVVYFRAGYTPNDYPSEVQWESRLLVERSRAIKCPSVFYHLFGAKKVQQQLCQPGEVERFVSPEEAKELRACFAGQCVPQRGGAGATGWFRGGCYWCARVRAKLRAGRSRKEEQGRACAPGVVEFACSALLCSALLYDEMRCDAMRCGNALRTRGGENAQMIFSFPLFTCSSLLPTHPPPFLCALFPTPAEEVAAMVAKARECPELFVLKPQREGGGNNVWGDDIAAALSADAEAQGYKSDEELLGFVLMERIMPPFHPALFMRGGEVTRGKATSELGVFGTFLGDGKSELHNEYAGYILRSKLEGVDEGGVAAGYAHMDVALLE